MENKQGCCYHCKSFDIEYGKPQLVFYMDGYLVVTECKCKECKKWFKEYYKPVYLKSKKVV